jgi:hypothetical protein
MSVLFGVDQDMGGPSDGAPDGASTADFKLISFYTVFAFLMMFGWAGLASYQQFNLSAALSMVIATCVGGLSMVLIAGLFRILTGFTSPGDTFSVADTVQKTGVVYQRIPSDGEGIIQITAGGLLREVRSISASSDVIESGCEVIVTRVVKQGVVEVRPKIS